MGVQHELDDRKVGEKCRKGAGDRVGQVSKRCGSKRDGSGVDVVADSDAHISRGRPREHQSPAIAGVTLVVDREGETPDGERQRAFGQLLDCEVEVGSICELHEIDRVGKDVDERRQYIALDLDAAVAQIERQLDMARISGVWGCHGW